MKPRIFVSTVTTEFRSARNKIGHVLEFLGYEVEQQDIFGTEGGDLRQMLRDKIDSCDALIQFAGDAYGAEPPEPDPTYGRVSYTQFEFLYARDQGKKTYVLFAGSSCQKDKPLDQLDLPAESNHPDPSGHQAELRDLQAAYRARLRTEGHLWHAPADDTALENSVLKLRNDSEQLRKEFQSWQKSVAKSQATTSRNLLILAALVLLLGAGGYLAWQSTRTQLTELSQPKPIDKSRIREHLTTASEEALARDLAEADAIQGDWERRQKLADAAYAAHEQRLSRVNELAAEFASIETGENASTSLTKMLRILDEQGSDPALDFLLSQSTRIIGQADSTEDLQPLLTGAQLAIANGRHEKAEVLFEQLLAPSLPNWPQARHEYILYLNYTKGSRQETHSTLAAALATYREARRQSMLLTLQYPDQIDWQRDLSVSHTRIGDISVAMGDLSAASEAYTADLEISEKLAALDPSNSDRQRDLSVSYDNLGHIAIEQGDLDAATKAYTASLKIAEKLAAYDPENIDWQRDLSVSYENLGDIAEEQGDLPAAATALAASLEIAIKLAASDPGDMDLQRDLSVSYERLGDIALKQDDLPAATKAYATSMGIIEKLVASDPANTEWQRDLSLSHISLGNVAMEQGDFPVAAKAYTAAIAISDQLAARDPGNIDLQSDLAANLDHLAKATEAQGDQAKARSLYQQSHDILQAITDMGKHLSPEDTERLAEIKEKLVLE